VTYALAIHGGAGDLPILSSRDEREEYAQSLSAALDIGRGLLQQGGRSLDAVEAVIRALEDDPKFNAGRGSTLNYAGQHELDASIMDGRTGSCGAVAAIRSVRHPISAARGVLEESPHILLSGQGADDFAKEMGLELVEDGFFRTQRCVDTWQRALGRAQAAEKDVEKDHFVTVGCVALDEDENLAAGTSTGGMLLKRHGRIGDSPLIGAGTFADNRTCAVSCTGIGERFIESCIAFDVSALMRYRAWTLDQSVQHIFEHTLPDRSGGLIAVGHDGSLALRFNTRGMYRGAANSKSVCREGQCGWARPK